MREERRVFEENGLFMVKCKRTCPRTFGVIIIKQLISLPDLCDQARVVTATVFFLILSLSLLI